MFWMLILGFLLGVAFMLGTDIHDQRVRRDAELAFHEEQEDQALALGNGYYTWEELWSA